MKNKRLIWKPIPLFEAEYSISNYGEIMSRHKKHPGQLLQQRIDRAGYLTVRLNKKGKTYTRFVHRLLAEAFIPNPQKKKFVNHRNGNKLDNHLSNLDFCTHQENVKHSYQYGLIKPVTKFVIDTCTGKIFPSAREAANHFGIKYGTLRNYLNGNIKNNPTGLNYQHLRPVLKG